MEKEIIEFSEDELASLFQEEENEKIIDELKDESEDGVFEKEKVVEETSEEKILDEEINTENEPEPVILDSDEMKEFEGVIGYLKNQNFINSDEEVTPSTLNEVLFNTLEDQVQNRLEEELNNFPQELIEMNKFVMQGGDINEYLDVLYSSKNSVDNIDLSDKSHQEYLVLQNLTDKGISKKEAESYVEYLKKSDGLEDHAKIVHKEYLQKSNEQKQQLLEQQKQQKEEIIKQERQLKQNFEKKLLSSATIGGLNVLPDDRSVLPRYITEKVETSWGDRVPAIERDIILALQDETKLFALAKFVHSGCDVTKLSLSNSADVTKSNTKKEVRKKNKTWEELLFNK